MRLNRKWILVIALVLSMATAISGTLAYLTSTDTATNTFTVGNVSIDLEEPSYTGNNQTLLPGVEIAKDPQIKNTGSSEAWVWMEITVPNDLMSYIDWNTTAWTKTDDGDADNDGNTVVTLKRETKLPAGETTEKAFTKVALPASLTSMPESLGTGTVDIVVNAFAIQDANFANVGAAIAAYDGEGGEGGEQPANGDDPSKTYEAPEDAYAVSNSEELTQAVTAGYTVIKLADGEYDVTNCGGKALSLYGSKNAVLKLTNEGEDGCDYGFGSSSTGVAHYTFNGITIDTTANTGNYKGYAYMGATFNDCSFVGAYSLNNKNTFEFNYCDFDFKNGYFWTWGAEKATFNNCDFNGNSKCILAHGTESTQITINNCKFAATEKGYTGAGDNTACVEMDPVGTNTYTINFTGNNTKTDNYSGWTRVKDGSTGHVINGLE